MLRHYVSLHHIPCYFSHCVGQRTQLITAYSHTQPTFPVVSFRTHDLCIHTYQSNQSYFIRLKDVLFRAQTATRHRDGNDNWRALPALMLLLLCAVD